MPSPQRAQPVLIGLLAAVLALMFCLPALAADPKDEIKKGNAAAQKGRQKEAIAHFSKAIDSGKLSKPNLAIALNNRGSAYDDLGQLDKAMADFDRAVAADPQNAQAYYNRSFVYEKKGNVQQALNDIEMAADLDPDDADYRRRQSYLLMKSRGQ